MRFCQNAQMFARLAKAFSDSPNTLLGFHPSMPQKRVLCNSLQNEMPIQATEFRERTTEFRG